MSTIFQPPSKSLTARDYQFIALVVVIFLGVCAALVFANLTLKGGGDFYVHWVGSRGFLFDKIDPYSGEVPARVQKLIYEHPAKAGDKPYILDTPFQILPLYYIFALLADAQLARAIFTMVLELTLFALAILSLHLTDWETPRIFTILFIFFAAFNFYTFRAIYEASPVLFLGLLYISILFTLRAEMDELTGALLAFSLYYWEVGTPFLLLVFLRVYDERRNRVFAGFFMLCFVMFVISFLSYPNWILPFLRAVINNARADYGFTIHAVSTRLWPTLGGVVARISSILLLIVLGYEISAARKAEFRQFYWACCLCLAAAPLLGFRTEMQNLAVLIIPLALIFAIVHDRWHRFGDALTIVLMLAIFMLPWALYISVDNQYQVIAQDTIFLFLPLSTLLGLYWIRWWAIRPPRVLSDIANRK